jgi:hypothetical protein
MLHIEAPVPLGRSMETNPPGIGDRRYERGRIWEAGNVRGSTQYTCAEEPGRRPIAIPNDRGVHMPKYRRMLSDIEAPYIQALMRLIDSQSKTTLANWAISYAEAHLLPIYEKSYPNDPRPRAALEAAREWLDGKVKLPHVKGLILEAHAAAREAEGSPAAQAAARTIGQAAATIHAATHSLDWPSTARLPLRTTASGPTPTGTHSARSLLTSA